MLLSKILRERAKLLPKAKSFYEAYKKLCEEHNAEIIQNYYGQMQVSLLENDATFSYKELV